MKYLKNWPALLVSRQGRVPVLWILLILLGVLLSTAAIAYVMRIPIATSFAQSYLLKKNISAKFKIEKLDWTEVLLTDINIEDGIVIPRLHIRRSSQSPQIGGVDSLAMDVERIDIQTTQKLASQFSSDDSPAESSSLPQFPELQKYCETLKATHVDIKIKELVHAGTTIPLGLSLTHPHQSESAAFVISGKELHLESNEKMKIKADDYLVRLDLVCSAANIVVSGSSQVNIKKLEMQSPEFKITNSFFYNDAMKIVATPDNKVSVHIPLKAQIDAENKTQKIKLKLPHFLLSGSVFLEATRFSDLGLSVKNFTMSKPHAVDIKNLNLKIINIHEHFSVIDGEANILGITYRDSQLKPLVQNINAQLRFQKNPDATQATIHITDTTKNLSLKNLTVTQNDNTLQLLFDKKNSTLQLNSQIGELIPLAKEHIKSLSGSVQLLGIAKLQDSGLSGSVKMIGKDLDVSSGYGDIQGLDFQYEMINLNTYASSPHQKITAKSITVGKVLENLSLDYQVHSLSHIVSNSLHLEHEGAQIDAGPFTANPLKKELKGFKATIKNLQLEKVLGLAMGVGPLIDADGTLSGSLAAELQGGIPSVRGQLKSDQEGRIQYRKEGEFQQKSITLSDTPMSILNNYLYNYYYKNLDLEIASNREYQMNVLLAAYGHNPDYLGGKPLKLKINLEQNVLGAIQTMMLSYNLPDKLKEKIEKAMEKAGD